MQTKTPKYNRDTRLKARKNQPWFVLPGNSPQRSPVNTNYCDVLKCCCCFLVVPFLSCYPSWFDNCHWLLFVGDQWALCATSIRPRRIPLSWHSAATQCVWGSMTQWCQGWKKACGLKLETSVFLPHMKLSIDACLAFNNLGKNNIPC